MTANDIITIPNPALRKKSRRIGHIDHDTVALATNMIEATLDWESTRQHESAAALAAVQIGALERVIIIRNDFEDKKDTSFSVFINPEIVKSEGEPTEELEGCLSVKEVYGSVARFPKIKIKALNLDGKPVRLTATGFLARVFQHEIDHINGVVFVDRVDNPHNLYHLEANGEFTPLNESLVLPPRRDHAA
jgi:peptide deformylase